MIQILPPTKRTRIAKVNINASMFQRAADEVSRCRRQCKCTSICTTPALRMPGSIAEEDQVPLITMANGMTVRMRERTKPVRYDLKLHLRAPVLSIVA